MNIHRTLRVLFVSLALIAPASAGATAQAATPAAVDTGSNVFDLEAVERPTLYFYFQPFCPYCKQAAPLVAKRLAEWAGKIDVVMLTDWVGYTDYSRAFMSDHGLDLPLIEVETIDYDKYEINGYPNFIWKLPNVTGVNLGPIGYSDASWNQQRYQSRFREVLQPSPFVLKRGRASSSSPTIEFQDIAHVRVTDYELIATKMVGKRRVERVQRLDLSQVERGIRLAQDVSWWTRRGFTNFRLRAMNGDVQVDVTPVLTIGSRR